MRLTHAITGLAILISLLSGCASPQKVVARGTPVSKELGYVGGLFVQKNFADVTGFTLTNLDTKQEFEIPFVSSYDKFNAVPLDEKWITETNVIALSPGKYAVTHWFEYNVVSHGRNGRNEFPSAIKEHIFSIEPGKLAFLGKFEGDHEYYGARARGIGQIPVGSRTHAALFPNFVASILHRNSHASLSSGVLPKSAGI